MFIFLSLNLIPKNKKRQRYVFVFLRQIDLLGPTFLKILFEYFYFEARNSKKNFQEEAVFAGKQLRIQIANVNISRLRAYKLI